MLKLSTLALLLCLLTNQAIAQNTKKYFGYYYNDANDSLAENHDHLSLHHIGGWSGSMTVEGRATSADMILTQLAEARQWHIKVIVPAHPFVFQVVNADTMPTWKIEPAASQAWSNFVDRLVRAGYLVPGNPEASTVAAIYLVDEPNITGLADQNGQAHPALVNAVTAIRQNPYTAKLPIASIQTVDFENIRQGMKLLDWVGFDAYDVSQSQWQTSYNNLKRYLSANQRTILVPKASSGCGTGGTHYDSPDYFAQILDSDPAAAWLAPFVWFSRSGCPGVRDIPSLREPYTRIGQTVRTQLCNSSPGEARFCRPNDISAIINMLLND